MKLKPLDDRIVVSPLSADEKTAGGVILPDSAKEKPNKGEVVAVGPGKMRDDGERMPPAVSVGSSLSSVYRLLSVQLLPQPVYMLLEVMVR